MMRIRTLLVAALFGAGAAFATTAEEYLREAETYLEQGKPQAAVIQLKNALQQDADNAQARFLLGKTYLDLGQGAAAAKELEHAGKLGVNSLELVIPLARAYLMQGEFGKVLNEIKPPSGAPPELRAEIFALQGDAELGLRDLAKAKETYQKAQAVHADNTTALLGLARIAMADKEFEVATANVDRALDSAPANGNVWLLKGEIARMQGDLGAAKEAFTRAVELAPTNALARLGKATVQIGLGEYEAAESEVAAVKQRFPQYPIANYLSAVLAYQKQDLTATEAALQEVLKAAPGHLPSALLLGTALYAQGKFEQARPQLQRYVTAVPNHAPAVKLLAATHLKLGQPRDAISVLEAPSQGEADSDAQRLALLGSAYLQAGDPNRATEWLEKAVAVAPDLAALRNQLAITLLRRGETEQAVSELETAVDLDQSLFQSDILLVLAHLRNRNFDAGLQAAEALAKKLPDNPMVYNLLGAIYGAKGELITARAQFEKSLALSPDYVAAIINMVRLDVRENKIEEAEARLRALLKRDGKQIAAMLMLAELETRRGRPDEALKWVERAWEKNPGALQPGLMLARYHSGKGEHLKALGIARELKRAHPNNPQALQLLGSIRLAMNEPASAAEAYEELIALQPKSVNAYLLLANAQAMTESYDAASETLNQALALQPDHLPAQAALVRLKQRMQKPQEALELARQIQQRHPNAMQGFALEGDLLMSQREFARAAESYAAGFSRQKTAELAVKLFQARRRAGDDAQNARKPLQEWLAENPDDQRVRPVLAQAYLQAGEDRAAIDEYQLLVRAQPENTIALNNLAWLLHNQNDATAVEYAQRAHKLAPDNPEITDTLGWLLLDHGDPKRGLELLQQAAGKAPHIPTIRYHLAVALSKNDREEQARKELTRLLRDHEDFAEITEARALLARLEGRPVPESKAPPPKAERKSTSPIAEPSTASEQAPASAKRSRPVQDRTSLEQWVLNWAKAWSAQDVDGYLAFYSRQFVPTERLSAEAWRQDRASKLTQPESIDVTILEFKVEREDKAYAQVSFVQEYRSDLYGDTTRKRLTLIEEDGTWKIVREEALPL